MSSERRSLWGRSSAIPLQMSCVGDRRPKISVAIRNLTFVVEATSRRKADASNDSLESGLNVQGGASERAN